MSYLKFSRREIFKFLATSPLLLPINSPQSSSPPEKEKKLFPRFSDGLSTPLFKPIALLGNTALDDLDIPLISETMAKAREFAPSGPCTAWGIPFRIGKKIILIKDEPVQIKVQPLRAKWLIFLHTTDMEEIEKEESGLYSTPFRGEGRLGEHVADYVLVYSDGTSESHPLMRRHQVGTYSRRWGENCLESVAPPQTASAESAPRAAFPGLGKEPD